MPRLNGKVALITGAARDTGADFPVDGGASAGTVLAAMPKP